MRTTEDRLRDAFGAAAEAVRVPVADRRAVIARSRRRRLLVAGGAIVALLAGSAVAVTANRPDPALPGPATYVALGRDGAPGLLLVDARTHHVIRNLSEGRTASNVLAFDVSPDGRRVVMELSAPKGGCMPLVTIDVRTGEDSVVPGADGGHLAQFVGEELAYARVACEPVGAFVGDRRLQVRPGRATGPASGRPVLARSNPAEFLHPEPDGSYAWHKAPDVDGCESELGVVVPQGRLVATLCSDQSSSLALIPDDPAEPARVLARLPERVWSLDADPTGRHALLTGGSRRLIRWDEGRAPRYLPSTALRAEW